MYPSKIWFFAQFKCLLHEKIGLYANKNSILQGWIFVFLLFFILNTPHHAFYFNFFFFFSLLHTFLFFVSFTHLLRKFVVQKKKEKRRKKYGQAQKLLSRHGIYILLIIAEQLQ